MIPEERIQKIADRWFLTEPLLFMTLMTHNVVPQAGTRRLRTGQGRIEYEYDYVLNQVNDSQLEELLRAEVIRILLRHPYRHHGSKAAAYIASNITLNENYTFNNLKYCVEDFWRTKAGYDGQNFEFYYREISQQLPTTEGEDENMESERQNSKESDGKENVESEGQNSNESNEDESESEGQNPNESDDEESMENEGQNPEESNEDENTDSERRSSIGGADGQPTPASLATLWDEDELMNVHLNDIIEIAQQSNSWGSLSDDLQEMLLATLRPELDYRKVLSGFRATIIASKKSLTRFRPSRRYGWMFMGKHNAFTTRLLIGIDVSASITDTEIRIFYSAINRFFKYGIEGVDALQFDSDLQGDPLPMKKAQRIIHVRGRGGTYFQPIVDYFAAHKRDYDGLIIFTDGYAPPPVVPAIIARKLLWICNDEANYREHQAWMQERGRCCWIRK
jgi:predicted metal-dependent peptidase